MKNALLVLVVLILPIFSLGECQREQNNKLRTVVDYDGTFTCKYKWKFCALIYYIEFDHLSRNDDVMFVRLKCTKYGFLHHHAIVIYKDGDGGDQYYEPKIEVFHDCDAEPYTILRKDFRLMELDVSYSNEKRKYSFQLGDDGSTSSTDHMMRFKDYIGENVTLVNEWRDGTLKYDSHPSLFEEYNDDIEEC